VRTKTYRRITSYAVVEALLQSPFRQVEMIPRRSSGSLRAERAVEPTRSANITVSWRRSARFRGSGPKALPGATDGRFSFYRSPSVHFFIFKSLPLKVLTIATINPSWVS
jgi:hypothetical protein